LTLTGLPPDVIEYAREPDRFAHVVDGSSVSRFDDGRVCVIQGPTWSAVSAIDVAEDEVGALVDQVHELVPPDKTCTWWLGPTTRPADLPERLLEHGLKLAKVPLVKALALVDEPPPTPPEIEVRRIATYEDFVAAREVQWEAFATPDEQRARQQEHLRADFDESMELKIPVGFLADLEGKPAATGLAVPSERGVFLIAGSTAPWARRRGLYTALVRARWDYAVERGTPAVVTQSVPDTSYPILKRLGFQDVGDVQRLEDSR
jgi:hypothetical protein